MPNHDLRLLALDGGGVRGLSALMILEQLMEAINPDAPPKPCDYFDMIGGTSTGGLIAIMLGRLRMSIDECIDAYLQLSDRIFQKMRHGVTVKGKIRGRFDSDELERAVKEVITEQGLPEDAVLKDTPGAACEVFVCATSKETSETVCLTSYKSPRGNSDLLNSVKIWEACRATSAASSFFDPIAIGRYKEEFVDGATGANNPVVELWNQAQLMWGPEPLEGKVQCLVSIGTGIPSLKAFRDDVLHIGKTLVAIATETEQTAERFRRDKVYLDNSSRYFRFNVVRGLEDIGLEESAKRKEIASATRRYVASQEVFKQMQACAGNLAGREYLGKYRTNFSLGGVPRVKTFVDRPAEIAEIEGALLPQRQNIRQKIFVLYGLGGIGKTQLAVEFARRHYRKFSSVFWLDGGSEVSLKLSIARCASRIPTGQISDASKTYSMHFEGNVDEVVTEVMGWLAQPDNTNWLIVLDNVDREYGPHTTDPLAYDVQQYFTGADHGSILITTRLARLEQLGVAQQVSKVDRAQAQAILKNWCRRKLDSVECERLLSLLDGLPLAIAQAGAFLQESGIGVREYVQFYQQQWDELMETRGQNKGVLQEYPDRSVWATWSISYNAIREKDQNTANLLLLWSCLDNKDLWHGLFAASCSNSTRVASELSVWIGDLSSNEVTFTRAMQLLRNHSLVEEVQDAASYATHAVVHKWAYHYQGKTCSEKLDRLAVLIVGGAVPRNSTRDYSTLQRRLLPHAEVCSRWVAADGQWKSKHNDNELGLKHDSTEEVEAVLDAVHMLGFLYMDQSKLAEAEKMYIWALQGKEDVLGSKHTSTLDTVNNLGIIYKDQGKLIKAEKMYTRALRGKEEALGPRHTSTLEIVHNLGFLYADQGRFDDAEKMYTRAMKGHEEIYGPKHVSTLMTVNCLGNLYTDQGKLGEAEKMNMRALQGYGEALGPKHPSTLLAVNNVASVYAAQDKLIEAEKMLLQARQGLEEAYGLTHTSTLNTVLNLGIIYRTQGKLVEAEKMCILALQGYEEALGPKHTSTLLTVHHLGLVYKSQGKLGEAEEMYMRALQGRMEALGPKHTSTLSTVNNLGWLYKGQGKLGEAEEMYMRALQGYEEVLGLKHGMTLEIVYNLGLLYANQGRFDDAKKMYTRAMKGEEEIYGPKHVSTLMTVNCLGNLYKDQGKLGEAEEMYMRALQGREEALGPKHTSTLSTVNNLGWLYKGQGKLLEAEKMFTRLLEGKEETLGLKHKSTLYAVTELASLHRNQGRLAQAEKMCLRALRECEETPGRKHESTIALMHILCRIFSDQGKYDKARKILSQLDDAE